MAAVGLAVVAAAAQHAATMGLALAAAVLGAVLARMGPAAALRRLAPLETLLLLVTLLLAWAGPAGPLAPAGLPAWSNEGLMLGGVIAMKANAVVLGLLALLGNMDASTLGHALAHLRVPQKLTHLLLFTVRYLDVLHREYGRLRAAMRIRSFRPSMSMHTYRAMGYLVGMLLVRSFDRSERVLAAMKCRGFRGRFYLLDHFAFSWRRDLPFCTAAALLAFILLLLEWA